MKFCTKCNLDKEEIEFHKCITHKDGLAYWCKVCASKNTRAHHNRNKENTEYRRKRRDTWMKKTHGISLHEYENKLKEQGLICMICNTELPVFGSSTHLDHDHTTGKLRDFLCTNCNRGLGHFKDSEGLLLLAAEYLRKHNT